MPLQHLSQAAQSFLNAWHGLRIDGAVPKCAHLLDRGPYSLMKNLFILESCPPDQTVRFMGTALTSVWEEDLTGRDFLDALGPGYRDNVRHLLAVAAYRPTAFSVSITAETLNDHIHGVNILTLPLAVEDGRPSRCAIYVCVGELGRNDRLRSFRWETSPRWLDIGFGCPEGLPAPSQSGIGLSRQAQF